MEAEWTNNLRCEAYNGNLKDIMTLLTYSLHGAGYSLKS
jgi:hypothetical protein